VGVATALLVALVEREEVGVLAGEFGRIVDLVLVDSEMHQRTAFEPEDRFARIAVLAVLLPGIPVCLVGKGILELGRRDGDTVDAQCEVYTQLRIRRRVVELLGDTETIRFIASLQFGIDSRVWLERRELDFGAGGTKAMTQQFERALAFEGAGQFLEKALASAALVGGF